MRSVLMLAKRNCLCFFRDRANVMFSLMAALIVVMLYLLVLRDMMISNYPGLPGVDNLIDAWVLAGLMGIISLTSCMGALQTMNTDRAEGKDTDFLVTPAGQWRLALGYILGTFVAAFLFT
jgi:multidrug/hemolysin transport system permease protein